jgi:hypothetical protein
VRNDSRLPLARLLVLPVAALLIIGPSSISATGSAVGSSGQSDLDAFMAKVLEKRNENWRTLHDYILSERERFDLRGPGDQRLWGLRREYTWYVKGGYLVRSPLKFDGVEIGEERRVEYEREWLRKEQEREARHADKEAEKEKERQAKNAAHAAATPSASVTTQASTGETSDSTDVGVGTDVSPEALVRRGVEPRFISEAYFLNFKFEPGNYYLVGRETLAGREVIRVEYYPKQLFTDRDDDERNEAADIEKPQKDRGSKGHDKEEEEFRRKMNKVALVTLWIDPREHQIVKYTFDNMDFGFLPGRWLARVTDISASMAMGQYLKGVWLPQTITVHAGVMLASGLFDASYQREFFDYRQGETRARIRSYTPKDR